MVKTRIKNDVYPTPERLYKAYLDLPLGKRPPIWEVVEYIFDPCCGDNNLITQIQERCALETACYGEDIWDGWDATRESDWADDWFNGEIGTTITNPPFNQAVPIIENALKFTSGYVIMLLTLFTYLCH